jgi:hypothetical protein
MAGTSPLIQDFPAMFDYRVTMKDKERPRNPNMINQ